MDILRANQNGNIVVVSFTHAESNPDLNEEARQLGLEPRYVYRVTQVADLGQGRQIVRVKNCSGQPRGRITDSSLPFTLLNGAHNIFAPTK